MVSARAVGVFHGVAATALAVVLVLVGAAAADAYRLPFIHGWALMHGSIFVVFPVCFALSYFLLRPLARRLHGVDPHTSVPVQRVSVLAVLSLLLSGGGFLIPFVGSVLGIATGHLARHRCKNDSQLTGSGFALAGLVLGYLGLAYAIYVFAMVSWIASNHGS